MSVKFSLSQIREFINKERVYMLMLSFIFLFNAFIIFSEKMPVLSEGLLEKKTFGPAKAEKKSEVETQYLSLTDKKTEIEEWSKIVKNKKPILTFVNILGLLAMCVFSLGLFLDIRILMAKIKKREILKATRQRLRVRWGIWDIFKLAIIFVFLGYILHIIEAHFLSSISAKKGLLTFIPLLNTGILDLVILGFIIYFIKIKYSQNLVAIGLKMKGAHKFIFLGVASYIAFLPILAFLLLLIIWLVSILNFQPPQQPFFKLFLQEERIWILVYSIIMVVLLGPFVEEVFFRGFTYNAIKRRWGAQSAMALTAVVFAGLHANLIGFLPILALGLLLAYMYEKTGSLIPSIVIHILHNAVMVTLLFLGRYFVRLLEGG